MVRVVPAAVSVRSPSYHYRLPDPHPGRAKPANHDRPLGVERPNGLGDSLDVLLPGDWMTSRLVLRDCLPKSMAAFEANSEPLPLACSVAWRIATLEFRMV
jgi:hypothetical protein